MIVGIDPGPIDQSCVLFDAANSKVLSVATFNRSELDKLAEWCYQYEVACEWMESFGMAVGQSVFQTVFQTGRIQQHIGKIRLVPRRDVKLTLCGSARAKDKNVRQALIDTIGPVGTKKNRGPLYGVSNHYWAALGVAYTASVMTKTEHEADFHLEEK